MGEKLDFKEGGYAKKQGYVEKHLSEMLEIRSKLLEVSLHSSMILRKLIGTNPEERICEKIDTGDNSSILIKTEILSAEIQKLIEDIHSSIRILDENL